MIDQVHTFPITQPNWSTHSHTQPHTASHTQPNTAPHSFLGYATQHIPASASASRFFRLATATTLFCTLHFLE